MSEIEKGIIETYTSIISHLKGLPGTKLEDLFRSSSVAELQSELDYLKSTFEKNSNKTTKE